MSGKDFDKIFREKLLQHGTPVDDSIWSGIESELDSRSKGAMWYTLFKYRKSLGYAASVAALLIVAFFIFRPESQPYIHRDVAGPIAILDENTYKPKNNLLKKQPIEKTTAVGARIVAELSYGADSMIAFVSEDPAMEEPAVTAEDSVVLANSVSEEVAVATADDNLAFIGSGQHIPDEYMEDLGLSKKKYSLSLFSNVVPNNVSVSRQYLGTMASSGISHSDNGLQSMEIVSEARHSLPLNLGMQVQVKVNSKISIGAGISYTWLRSKYDGLINKKFYRIRQSLHYIGVPVNVYFTLLESNRLQLYTNFGGAIERGIKASYEVASYDGTSYSTDAKIDGFQYSANAGLGLEYKFSEQVGLYLEPNVVYFFDSKIPASIRTDQPLQIKAEVGFRFHLNK